MNTKKHYVYYLRRPDKKDPFEPEKGLPFYVGRGTNGRYLSHRSEAKKETNDPSPKVKIIRELWAIGLDFTEDVVIDGLTNEEAKEWESQAIETYGYEYNCLVNIQVNHRKPLPEETIELPPDHPFKGIIPDLKYRPHPFKRLLRANDITQKYLEERLKNAGLTGVFQSTLSLWLSGKEKMPSAVEKEIQSIIDEITT